MLSESRKKLAGSYRTCPCSRFRIPNSPIQCICGTTYCDDTCRLKDVKHALLCDADFHIKIRNLVNMGATPKYYINNISRPRIDIKRGADYGNSTYSFMAFNTFPWLPSDKFGCLLCGEESKESTSPTYINGTNVKFRPCNLCINSKNHLCRDTRLPRNVCFDGVRKRLFQVWLLLNWISPSGVDIPSDVCRYVFSIMFTLDVDLCRLKQIGATSPCECLGISGIKVA